RTMRARSLPLPQRTRLPDARASSGRALWLGPRQAGVPKLVESEQQRDREGYGHQPGREASSDHVPRCVTGEVRLREGAESETPEQALVFLGRIQRDDVQLDVLCAVGVDHLVERREIGLVVV